jgi:hypothetical protein
MHIKWDTHTILTCHRLNSAIVVAGGCGHADGLGAPPAGASQADGPSVFRHVVATVAHLLGLVPLLGTLPGPRGEEQDAGQQAQEQESPGRGQAASWTSGRYPL